PDPSDHTYTVEYALLLRSAAGEVTVAHDRHIEGLFSRVEWLQWFEEAAVPAQSETDSFGRLIFLGRKSSGL
ncbi:MAG TPA: hypothetical protein VD930_07115, partial [Gemmatimonadales bacterium]|nr:hypothetical protein [Gemmatimonadales bacterium]